MRTYFILCSCITFSLLSCLAPFAEAGVMTIEPDDYPSGTVLNTIDPNVTLFSNVNAGDLTGSFGFNIQSAEVSANSASTGTRVFSHAGVGFFNANRNLRMTFAETASFVALDFVSSSFNEGPVLRVYGESQQLLDELILAGLGNGTVQTLTFTRPQGDIKFAEASGVGPFIRIDHLRYELASNTVPEPSSILAWVFGCSALTGIRRSRRHRLHDQKIE